MSKNRRVVVYDFSWDDQGDLGLWVFDGREEVLVEAMERISTEVETRYNRLGEPSGEYTLVSGKLPEGAGVLLPGAAKPVFGVAAESAWDRLVRASHEGAMVDNGRGVGGIERAS